MLMLWEDIGGRPYMEDRMAYDTSLPHEFSYFGVYDGHGGSEVSNYLQAHMGNVIKKHILRSFNSSSNYNDVSNILFESIREIVHNIPISISMDTGSTAVVMLKRKKNVWLANIGDSRAIMNNGHNCIDLTKDHKPDDPTEYKRILSLGGKVTKAFSGDVYRVNGSLAVSRAIGDFSLAPHVTWKPDITVHSIEDMNHYVFIATDGIWDVISNKEVIKIINQNAMTNTWKDIGNSLITLARQRNSSDNISCMLIVL